MQVLCRTEKGFNYVHAAFGNRITGGLIYADQVSKYEIWVVGGGGVCWVLFFILTSTPEMRGACGASGKAAVARQQSNTSDGTKNFPQCGETGG